MIRRATAMLAMLSVLAIAAALPASAKMPPFEVDVTVNDGAALIRVSFPLGASEGLHPADLDRLLAVYPTGDLDDRGRPITHGSSLPVDLEWVAELGWYEARVEIEGAGAWAVVPFPTASFDADFESHHEYPTTVGFEVPASSDRSALWVGGVLILLTLGGRLLYRSRP